MSKPISLQYLIKGKQKEEQLKKLAADQDMNREKLDNFKQNGLDLASELGFETKEKIRFTDYIKKVDFSKLADSSDFKRLIYYSIIGKTWRGSNQALEKSLLKLLNKVQN